MIQITELPESKLDEIAAQIGESFCDYPYEAGEGGLKAMIPSREAMNAYMKALVRAGIASGTFYATSERGEGYILLTDSFGGHPDAKTLAKMFGEIKDALGGWKRAAAFFKAAAGGGETLETKMKKKKRPFVKVEMLLVTKPYQGQGYMRRLMEFAYEQADAKRAAVILDTDARGKCARYEHLGMKLAGVRETAGYQLYDLIREPEEYVLTADASRRAAVIEPRAVAGTNSWGSAAYEKALRGDSVDEGVLKETVNEALGLGLTVFDTAQDYGFGEGQRLIGRLCPPEALISAKYTPGTKYGSGQVIRSFAKDLADFGRDYVDIYWLHLPNHIEENLGEMIKLYRAGRVGHIGVSNFDLDECKRAKAILNAAGVPLFGVQNHYSLIAREWEQNGLLAWCKENGVQFWAWAVLEEGILVPQGPDERASIMKTIFQRKRKRLAPLHARMAELGAAHGLTAAQVAIAFCSSKGVVPVCGCRKPYQAKQLAEAAAATLPEDELRALEAAADAAGVKVLGADMFRFAVKKN